ncbi:hypothetical protein DFS33DRAFT_345755 [Desarmillaria ectypa]|nr:hypothetical protein DFS33DRAFT_345755 [Desarmillaria ectypa]
MYVTLHLHLVVKAMSEIIQALGKSQDAETYSSTAESYVKQWPIWAGSTGHLLSTYGTTADPSSWSLVYNLFADLTTALVDSNVFTVITSRTAVCFYRILFSSWAAIGQERATNYRVKSEFWTNCRNIYDSF